MPPLRGWRFLCCRCYRDAAPTALRSRDTSSSMHRQPIRGGIFVALFSYRDAAPPGLEISLLSLLQRCRAYGATVARHLQLHAPPAHQGRNLCSFVFLQRCRPSGAGDFSAVVATEMPRLRRYGRETPPAPCTASPSGAESL